MELCVVDECELYAEIGSPRLGFVADFSATMRRMSPTLLRKLAKLGLAQQDLQRLQEIWATDADIKSGTASSPGTCTRAGSRRSASARSPGWRSTCTATSTHASGPTSCRRSCTCTPSARVPAELGLLALRVAGAGPGELHLRLCRPDLPRGL
jgi:hypothetical protein